MEFSRQAIQQGRLNQQKTEETPETFGTIDSSAQVRPTRDLDIGNQRMAGQVGARALSMMNNPVEAQRTAGWMQRFGMSNQGMQFNQAKMMMQAQAAQAMAAQQQQKGK